MDNKVYIIDARSNHEVHWNTLSGSRIHRHMTNLVGAFREYVNAPRKSSPFHIIKWSSPLSFRPVIVSHTCFAGGPLFATKNNHSSSLLSSSKYWMSGW